jgi:hypothetical protein
LQYFKKSMKYWCVDFLNPYLNLKLTLYFSFIINLCYIFIYLWYDIINSNRVPEKNILIVSCLNCGKISKACYVITQCKPVVCLTELLTKNPGSMMNRKLLKCYLIINKYSRRHSVTKNNNPFTKTLHAVCKHLKSCNNLIYWAQRHLIVL